MEIKLKEQKKVLQLFGRFVPEDIITKHLEATNGKVDDAELKTMTLLFCDIRGFTSIVEGLSPKQAVIILQHFYTIMSDVISTYSGMVNQYVGDEIFATFGDPFSFPGFERHAVFCALEMMSQLKDLNELCKDFISSPLKIGIGIHSGEVVTGTLGSSNKIEYSVTGDTVNTSKRIESLTQSCPNTILISHTVYEAVKDLVNVKVWTPMSVKGKAEPIEIYEVLSKK
jgi:adenylate cyclase